MFQRPLTLILLQKYRDTNGRRIVIQIGGVYTTFCQKEGILLQKYRDRNGRCIAILFKSIGVRGRCDFPEIAVLIPEAPYVGERFCVPCTRKPPNGPSKNLLGTRTGFLEARSGVCVFRVSSVALQKERFCAPCTRKPPNGPSKNLLKTTQGS